MPLKILFADDEPSLQDLMSAEIPTLGHSVLVCPDGVAAIRALREQKFDCLLVDLDMPGANGLEVIREAKETSPEAEAIILTGKGTLDTAITALREGVFDYLRKPCLLADIEKVLLRVEEKQELTRRYLAIENLLQRSEGSRKLVGSSLAMRNVHNLIDRVAPTESTVVILGETGTGKELVARAIHERSLRREKPFVAVNCGALPENLIESELFGHRKGSFTGADENRLGLLQVADGGTLFLDEIGELPKGVQAKLLRFLECGEVRRIGENNTTTCDVRVVCATLRNLESMVRSGDFREDLWFRINTFEIVLPPLRERLEDLPELSLYLAKRFPRGAKVKRIEELFTPEAMQRLAGHSWPGNVRQLANAIEHAFILSDDLPMPPEALPQPIRLQRNRDAAVPTAPNDPDSRNISSQQTLFRERERLQRTKPERPVMFRSGKMPVVPSGSKPSGPSESLEELLAFDPGFSKSGRAAQDDSRRISDATEQFFVALPTKTLRDLERDAIESALNRNEGNKTKAAEELGISLKTLYNKLNQGGESGKKSA